jgi:hypothetical protein
MFLSFRVSGNGLLFGSLLLGFLSNRPPSFSAYTEISIYSARVSSLARSKVSIKLIFFFLKFELELNSKVDNYHYLEGKDYLEDKDRMAKAHCSP